MVKIESSTLIFGSWCLYLYIFQTFVFYQFQHRFPPEQIVSWMISKSYLLVAKYFLTIYAFKMNGFVPLFHSNSECLNTLDLRHFINFFHQSRIIYWSGRRYEDSTSDKVSWMKSSVNSWRWNICFMSVNFLIRSRQDFL